MSQKFLILDRDGVINDDSPNYIKTPQEWQPIPGAIEAIAQLSQAGWQIAVATNQSGLARGLFDVDTLKAMHEKMTRLITAAGGQLAAIVFCPHHPDEGCVCRKPKPGLLHQLQSKHHFILSPETFFVGDSQKDLDAALEAGVTPVLVETGKGLTTKENLSEENQNILIFPSLSDFSKTLL